MQKSTVLWILEAKPTKEHFDRAERVKCKALRVSAQGVYFR
ncbi:hypothetical protein [Porphyromonas pogonae]|nr:hypothetical protein [Porphyromonas pogonae]